MERKFMLCNEDYSGLVGAMLEANMSWNTIEMQCMSEEAIIMLEKQKEKTEEAAATGTVPNENSSSNEVSFLDKTKGVAKKFFESIIQWFKDLWAKIVDLLGKLKNKLATMFIKNDKYFAMAKRKTSFDWKGNSDKKISIHNWTNMSGKNLSTILSIANAISNKISKVEDIESMEQVVNRVYGGKDLEQLIKSKILNNSETVEIPVKTDTVNDAINFCTQAKNTINLLNGIVSSLKSEINSGTKAAQRGLKETVSSTTGMGNKVKTKFNESKKIATSKKNTSMLLSKLLNVLIKYVLMQYSDCMKIVKSAIGGAKQDLKDDAKAKKDAAKSVKNDSLFLNFNNDYNLYSEDITDVLGESFLLDFDEM